MFLIAGLGNPGREYAGTRHNIGFDMLTYLADKYDIAIKTREGNSLTGKGYIEGQKVILAQPQTYMNNSGLAIRALSDFYKIPIENIIIIFDDINLDLGKIRVRPKGSAGGHNGIKSIISHLGTQDFARIKIGVGDKPQGGNLVKHVLGRFSRKEDEKIRDIFANADLALVTMITQDIASAMNKVNGL